MSLSHLSTKYDYIKQLGITYLNIIDNNLQTNHNTIFKNLKSNQSSLTFDVFNETFLIQLETDHASGFMHAAIVLHHIDSKNNQTIVCKVPYDKIGNIAQQYSQNDFVKPYIDYISSSIEKYVSGLPKIILK